MPTTADLLSLLSAYLPGSAQDQVACALDLARQLYGDRARQSGGSLYQHAVSVAGILAGWQAPVEIVIAGLLHDVLPPPQEAGEARRQSILERVEQVFGGQVASLVSQVVQVSRLVPVDPLASFEEFTEHEENLIRLTWVKELLVRMPEAAVIKIADRLESFSSLEALPVEAGERFAAATQTVFIPLAYGLGMGQSQAELEDSAFRILSRANYERMQASQAEADAAKAAAPALAGEDGPQETLEKVARELEAQSLAARVYWEPVSRFELYRREQLSLRRARAGGGLPAEMAAPLVVECDSLADCYRALGILHGRWPPVSASELRDYIARPQENGFRALQTRVQITGGQKLRLVRVLVRDRTATLVARRGFTARWLRVPEQFLPRLTQQVVAKEAASLTSITVFTPRGKPIVLPKDATPLDFAFELHTDIGLRCAAANRNGQAVALDAPLHNGDRVEIITGPAPLAPQPEWLKAVKTRKARHALNVHLKGEETRPPVRARLLALASYRSAMLRTLHLAASRLGDDLQRAEVTNESGLPFRVEMTVVGAPEKLDLLAQRLRRLGGVVEAHWQLQVEAPAPAVPAPAPANPHTLLPVSGELFVGRHDDLESLMKNLRNLSPGSSVLVWGQRRIGKTSLLKQFALHYLPASGGFLPVYVDMQNVGGKSTLGFLRYVVECISAACQNKVPAPEEHALLDDPLKAFARFLLGLLKQESRRLVLMVDEFELFSGLAEQRISRAELFNYLRGTIQEGAQINVILSGGGVLQKLLEISGVTPLLNVARYQHISFLSFSSARRLICMSGERVSYAEEVIQRLLELTHGHPYYIQLLCGELVDRCKDSQVSPAALAGLLEDWLPDQPAYYFEHLWGANIGVDPRMRLVYRHVLVVVAQLKDPESGWTRLEKILARPITAPPIPFSEIEVLQEMVEMETLEEQGGAYRIAIPLLEKWLLENYSIAKSAREIAQWKP